MDERVVRYLSPTRRDAMRASSIPVDSAVAPNKVIEEKKLPQDLRARKTKTIDLVRIAAFAPT